MKTTLNINTQFWRKDKPLATCSSNNIRDIKTQNLLPVTTQEFSGADVGPIKEEKKLFFIYIFCPYIFHRHISSHRHIPRKSGFNLKYDLDLYLWSTIETVCKKSRDLNVHLLSQCLQFLMRWSDRRWYVHASKRSLRKSCFDLKSGLDLYVWSTIKTVCKKSRYLNMAFVQVIIELTFGIFDQVKLKMVCLCFRQVFIWWSRLMPVILSKMTKREYISKLK